jgi:hypothetical protein
MLKFLPLLVSAILLFAVPVGTQESGVLFPLDAYRPEDRSMADGILNNATIETNRELTFPADPAVFHFFVDHPDFAAAISQGLDLSEFQVNRDSERYQISHGHDHGFFWVVERQPEWVAYLATGTSERPIFRLLGINLRARSYVLEKFESVPSKNLGNEQTVRLQAYLHVENRIFGTLLRWMAPFVRRAFETEVTAAFEVAPQLSEMAYREGRRFLEKVRRLPDLDKVQLAQFKNLIEAQEAVRPISPGTQGD